MKYPISILVILMLFLVVINSQAQKKPAPRPKTERTALQVVSVFVGQVGDWVSNDDYVYEGFYLVLNDKKYLVKFPTHLGLQLTIAMKTGNAISVSGIERTSSSGVKQIDFISISANGQDIYNMPVTTVLNKTPAEDFVNGTGKITKLQKNSAGEVYSFVLDDETILRVSTHIGQLLNKVIAVGNTVFFKGLKKNLSYGESSAINYTIVKCQTITFNGVQYLTRE